MSIPYVCCTKRFEEHYSGQTGQGLPYYRGLSRQKGYGLGGVFRHFFRTALPFLVKGAKTIGKEALVTGSRIAQDVISGQNFKTASKQRAKEASKILAQKAINKAQSMIGNGNYKKKRKILKRLISSKFRKVKGRDIFDP